MIQNAPERRLEALQLLCWSNFPIQSVDKPISAINRIINCRTDLIWTSMDKCHKSGDKIFWESCTRTLHLPTPINTPADATQKASSVQQRAKVRIFRVFLSSRLDFLFFLFSREGDGYVEGDTDVCFSSPLYQVMKVIFIFIYVIALLFFLFSFSFLLYFCWSLMSMQAITEPQV